MSKTGIVLDKQRCSVTLSIGQMQRANIHVETMDYYGVFRLYLYITQSVHNQTCSMVLSSCRDIDDITESLRCATAGYTALQVD